MREKNVLIIVIAIILLCVIGIGAYVSIQPSYKNITMSQMTLEVPESNVIVTNCSENYNIYNDTKNNLTIRSWSAKIANDPLDTNASEEIGLQAGENFGVNTTYNNISVFNKSGTYTYFDIDMEKCCMIVITGNNVDDVVHAAKTINKSSVVLFDGSSTMSESLSKILNASNLITPTASNPPSSVSTGSSSSKQSSSSPTLSEEMNGVVYSPNDINTAHTPQDVKQRMFDESDSNGDGILTGSEIDSMEYKLKHSPYAYRGPYG
ncbi:hypothetical protein [Methanosphaera stadtmanae]|uniref:EF-hand domain-containing protein n=1 Tax=Methanosphaera stadtmanae TaxID=2317 RepID=A0A328Q4K4_9EURY|nr:hypothetical protein [Methanosphaera stadtmanae]RAP03175.1 hypothetical protein CA615_03680 [Methanosphaera stadtmanae]